MRWRKARRSDNLVDARGRPGGMRVGGKGLSLGGVAVIVILGQAQALATDAPAPGVHDVVAASRLAPAHGLAPVQLAG